jgi:hypothetical protein
MSRSGGLPLRETYRTRWIEKRQPLDRWRDRKWQIFHSDPSIAAHRRFSLSPAGKMTIPSQKSSMAFTTEMNCSSSTGFVM